jgi:hypothetical protein
LRFQFETTKIKALKKIIDMQTNVCYSVYRQVIKLEITMNEIIEKTNIESMIYEIRGKQVMLDSDLAKLYQCTNGTKTINLAVKRNRERFPEDFYFQLNDYEYDNLRFQFETSSLENYGGRRYLPRVFTEQGVAMLATILRTPIASEVSIDIMRAFVKMRKYISTDLKYMNNMLIKHDGEIKILQESFDKLSEKRKNNEIYFNGMIYDAYSKIIDIMKEAKKELIIIDSYADKTILDMISKLKIEVILITKEKSLLSNLDIEKYNKQYNNLKIKYDNTFHDRYLIIDKSELYHLGTSLNHIGEKTFSINKIEDDIILKALLEKLMKDF